MAFFEYTAPRLGAPRRRDASAHIEPTRGDSRTTAEFSREASKIQCLEGLRGVMAWWVVLGHVSLSFGWRLPLIDRNMLAVDVFILLSGLVGARLIDRKAERYRPYIIRRAWRLFPLYLVVLALSTGLLPIQMKAWSGLPFDAAANAARLYLAREASADLPAHLAVHLPLLQGLVPNTIFPGAAYTLVGQAWSLSLEWQFYLVAPVLMWGLASRSRWPLVVAATGCLCLAARHFPEGFLGARILQFLIGMCGYLALERISQRRVWIPAAIALSIAAIAFSGAWQIAPLSIGALVLVSSAARPGGRLQWPARMLGSRLATHFGRMSYSLYLVHMIPLYGSIFVLRRLGVSDAGLQIGALVATLVGTYVIALITFAFVEKPGIALGAKLAARSALRAQRRLTPAASPAPSIRPLAG